MKRHLTFLLAVLAPLAAGAQGSINFNTRVGLSANTTAAPGAVWAPVFLPDPSYPYSGKFGNPSWGIPPGTQTYGGGFVTGTGFTAQLWGGPEAFSESDLVLVSTTTFRTHTITGLAGTVNPPILSPTVPGVPGGQYARFQLRVWENNGGTITSWAQATSGTHCCGASRSFVSAFPLGAPPVTPSNLQGLESFELSGSMCMPEPSVLALGALGVAIWLCRRHWR